MATRSVIHLRSLRSLRLRVCVSLMLIATVLGCDRFIRGGGSRGVSVGSTRTEVVYGIGAGKRLEFVILTDLPSNGTQASAGSTWAGRIAPKNGPVITYKSVGDGMDIDGTVYDMEDGRVFLVSTGGEAIAVEQVNVEFTDANFEVEFDRVTALPEVTDFLEQSVVDEERSESADE